MDEAPNLCGLENWDLPDSILTNYHNMGLHKIFPWQLECLQLPGVLNGKNLVYAAPTSAGKSLVVEILLVKRLLETRKKAIMILPFVSVAREKMFSMKGLFEAAGLRVDGYMGGVSPPGGFSSLDIAVCTIEKANSLINKLIEDQQINQLCMLIVDELHMVGDDNRGYLIELLLTKIRFMCENKTLTGLVIEKPNIQIVAMSATIPNLGLLSLWLNAASYQTDFRPVPLQRHIKIGEEILDETLDNKRDFCPKVTFLGDEDGVSALCYETLDNGQSVLIFCPTKNWCEKLSKSIAFHFYQLNCKHTMDTDLPHVDLNLQELREINEQLFRSPAGMDDILCKTIPLGVAFHHAGLTTEERDIIEAGFRSTAIRVLVATSTLSSGVNLPARRVIIRSPTFNRNMLDVRTYHQMAGRAGRKGIDEIGESILICKPHEKNKGQKLVTSKLLPVKSCLVSNPDCESQMSAALKRAILEIIVNGIASTYGDVQSYLKCTLLSAQLTQQSDQKTSMSENCTDDNVIRNCIKWLQDHEFVYLQHENDSSDDISLCVMTATQLGRAALISSLPTSEALRVLADLQTSAKSFALDTELHLIYQVTPIYSTNTNINWFNFLAIYEDLCPADRRVSKLVGVEESFLTRLAATGGSQAFGRMSEKRERQINIHSRFYAALMLHDLVREVPLSKVCEKFDGNRGTIQSLQQSAASFAGMVTAFCQQLGWWSLEVLLREFQTRLVFGVQRELLDLTQISLLNNERARALYDAGLTTCENVAKAKPSEVAIILINSNKFISKRANAQQKNPEESEKIHGILIPGNKSALTEEEAAIMIVNEAKTITNMVDTMQCTQAIVKDKNLMNGPNVPDTMSEDVENHLKSPELSKSQNAEQKECSLYPCSNVRSPSSVNANLNSKHHFSQLSGVLTKAKSSKILFEDATKLDVNVKALEKSFEKLSFAEGEIKDLSIGEDNDTNLCNKNDGNSNQHSFFSLDVFNDCTADNSLSFNQNAQGVTKSSDEEEYRKVKACSSITESQMVALLDADFSILKTQHSSKIVEVKSNVLDHKKSSSHTKNAAEELSEKLFPMSNSLSSSTPVAVPTKKASSLLLQESGSFLDQSDETDSKENIPPPSFHISGHENSINNLLSTQNSFSNELFNNKPKDLNQQNEKETSLINWSSESAFNCNNVFSCKEQGTSFNSDLFENGQRFHKDNASQKSPLSPPIPNNAQRLSDGEKQLEEFDQSKSFELILENQDNHSETILSDIPKKNFTIVDICPNSSSMKKFLREWMKHSIFGLSLDVHQKPGKIDTGTKLSSIEASGFNDAVNVNGLSVYWGQNKIHYIKLQESDTSSQNVGNVFHKNVFSTAKLRNDIAKVLVNFKDSVVIVSHNVKQQFKTILNYFGVVMDCIWQDPDIALWLSDSETRNDDMCKLMKQYVPEILPLLNKLLCLPNTKKLCATTPNKCSNRVKSCIECVSSFYLMQTLKSRLQELEMWKSFTDIEMPHIVSMALLECNGVAIDIGILKEQRTSLHKACQTLQEEAWKIVGRKFNLSSPTEVGKILFCELGLVMNNAVKKNETPFKKNKRATVKKRDWSTSKEVLEQLCQHPDPHPLPRIIMHWRSLHHGLNKVLHPLHSPLAASPKKSTSRYHPTTLACTSTGRISMLEPNIQNIPKTFTVVIPAVNGKSNSPEKQSFTLRDILVATKEHVLLSADYSQLELRIMAHLSQDDALLRVFSLNCDVFRIIASEMTGKEEHPDLVTDEERTNAKRICYGILYGMGLESLSRQMNTTEVNAQTFVDKFMKSYPKLQAYLRRIVEQCKEKGYITTVAGRRRYLPDIRSPCVRARSHAERQAVNSTVQGSAADLVKSATCKISREMRRLGWDTVMKVDGTSTETSSLQSCYLVHHIHDEIMFEVRRELVSEAARIIRQCMLDALPLLVRLDVKMKTGPSWGSLSDYFVD